VNKDWQQLTKITQGKPFIVERILIPESGIAVEGRFEPPPLAALPPDDQVFVAAFVRCHGSIKQMEKFFGVSYPTIKNRLNRIGEQLTFVAIESEEEPIPTEPPKDPAAGAKATRADILDRLESGELTFDEAMEQLQNKGHKS